MTDTGNELVVFDTTLRDGEQSPGATMREDEKLAIAPTLARMGVDVIEAGFPAASPADHDAVEQVARTVGNGKPPATDIGTDADDGTDGSREPLPVPTIAGLARAKRSDIDDAFTAVRDARDSRVHTFLGTSPTHREDKLGLTKPEILGAVEEAVSYACSLCEDVEFSPEDASRTEPGFLGQVVQVALDAGATTINLPDTVGYATPREYQRLIEHVQAHTEGLEEGVLSVHCHDDLGLATANTLAGVQAGARQVEVTINGVGERAGNTALEEVAVAIATRPESYAVETPIETGHLHEASQLVSTVTGFPVPPNKAVVGDNAFAHEAGIHQDGVLKNPATYEILDPDSFGTEQRLVLGKHSGRHAVKAELERMGYDPTADGFERLFENFQALADERARVPSEQLERFAEEHLDPAEAPPREVDA